MSGFTVGDRVRIADGVVLAGQVGTVVVVTAGSGSLADAGRRAVERVSVAVDGREQVVSYLDFEVERVHEVTCDCTDCLAACVAAVEAGRAQRNAGARPIRGNSQAGLQAWTPHVVRRGPVADPGEHT